MSRIDELIAEHCPIGVGYASVSEVFSTVPTPRGIKRSDYSDGSKIAIVDQGQTLVAGYTDDDSLTLPESQYVVFGDHTRAVKWIDFPFAVGADGIKVLKTKPGILPKFGYYALSNLPIADRGYNRHWSVVRDLKIPVPPLAVQREIVRILDTFSKMEAELEAELEARKQQYEHYQYQVFNGLRNSGVNLAPLSEIGRWYGGGTPSKSESSYWTNGSIPWISPKDMGSPTVTQTEDYITNEAVSQSSTKLVPKNSIAIVVRSSILEHTLPIAFVPIESSLNQDMKAVIPAEGISARYVFHALRAARSDILRQAKRTGGSVASLDSKKLWKFEIPVPDSKEQERVNQFFDRFDALTSDLSAGLPAELVARRQQYEYYREKLLSFKELEPAS